MNCQRCLFCIAKFNHLKDYYAVLKISKTNDQSTIKKAYYALAKEFHPDLNHGREDKFKEINEAYEVLSDENTKRDYDNLKSGMSNHQEAQSEQYSDPRKNYANQQQQAYRPNSNYNQNWNTRTAYEQAFRQAQQNFYYQQQTQQKSKRSIFDEERRRQEETMNEMAQEAQHRQQRDRQARQHYQEQERKKQQFYSEREREAYESYLRQKEFEQYQKEKFEEYRYKAEDIEQSIQNMQKNWSQIKQNVSSIWNAFKGKKE